MLDETWHAIWERKGEGFRNQSGKEQELFKASGYDTPLGGLSESSRRQMMLNIVSALGIKPGTRLLDVGCGAGAILALLRETGAHLAGVDYSTSLVNIARKHLPGERLRKAEASALPFGRNEFDAVLSNGVFLYFRDLEYATAALREMVRVCRDNGRMFITDIPDLAKRQSCVAERLRVHASVVPEHLYYAKQFFEDFAGRHSIRVEMSDQDISGYANSRFRFNARFEKQGPVPD